MPRPSIHWKRHVPTKYKRVVAGYLEKVGWRVSWQKLGGAVADATLRFQVVGQGEHDARRDELSKLLND